MGSIVSKQAHATPTENAEDKDINEMTIKWKERIVTMHNKDSFDREVTNKHCVNLCELIEMYSRTVQRQRQENSSGGRGGKL